MTTATSLSQRQRTTTTTTTTTTTRGGGGTLSTTMTTKPSHNNNNIVLVRRSWLCYLIAALLSFTLGVCQVLWYEGKESDPIIIMSSSSSSSSTTTSESSSSRTTTHKFQSSQQQQGKNQRRYPKMFRNPYYHQQQSPWKNSSILFSTIVQQHEHQHHQPVTVDILTLGSITRSQFWRTQRNTWATHPIIRNIFVATEDDIDDPIELQSCLSQNASFIIPQFHSYCVSKYSSNQSSSSSWLMNRYMHVLLRPRHILQKENPLGWFCAQPRFPLSLSRTILGYTERHHHHDEQEQEDLPDYLLLVDDDTYMNLDSWIQEVVFVEPRKILRNSSIPYVAAACRARNGKGDEYNTFPIGGFGTTFSKGSLERFRTPIHIEEKKTFSSSSSSTSITPPDDTLVPWMDHVQYMLQYEHLILEHESYQYGMSIIELMETFTQQEKLYQIDHWKRGFCFHGDWLVAIFVMLYRIGGPYPRIETIQNSNHLRSRKMIPSGICANVGEHCSATSLSCHYQTPDTMMKFYKELTTNNKQ